MAHCNRLDDKYRCLECRNSYYWVEYNCVISCTDPENEMPCNSSVQADLCDPVGRYCAGERNILTLVGA